MAQLMPSYVFLHHFDSSRILDRSERRLVRQGSSQLQNHSSPTLSSWADAYGLRPAKRKVWVGSAHVCLMILLLRCCSVRFWASRCSYFAISWSHWDTPCSLFCKVFVNQSTWSEILRFLLIVRITWNQESWTGCTQKFVRRSVPFDAEFNTRIISSSLKTAIIHHIIIKYSSHYNYLFYYHTLIVHSPLFLHERSNNKRLVWNLKQTGNSFVIVFKVRSELLCLIELTD